MRATVRQCAVLIDGEDSLLPCGDRPFLAWLLREFTRFGVEEFLLLAGDGSGRLDAAVPAIAATLPKPAKITVFSAPAEAGAGGALVRARALLDARFLVCRGGALLDVNLARLLADAARDDANVLGRTILCPSSGLGIHLFDRRALDFMQPSGSLERGLLPDLDAQGMLRRTIVAGSVFDLAIPADRERARGELPARLRRPALFLDRDGVINIDHGYVGTRERFEWNDGAREAIQFASDKGFHVFVVTNQSGVARGLYSEEQLAALHGWMIDEARAAGGAIDDLRSCPFHPQATVEKFRRASDWRKPAPGMLLDLMARWELDPSRCVLIGDQSTDMEAAEAAGALGVRYVGGDLPSLTRTALDRIEGGAV